MKKKNKILLYFRIIGGITAILWAVYSNIANIFDLPTFGDWRWGLLFGNLAFFIFVFWHILTLETTISNLKNLTSPEVKLYLQHYTPNPNAEGDRWIGVRIINKSGVRSIERCKARLYQITNLSSDIPYHLNGQLPSDLHWSDNNRPDDSGFVTIPREGEVSLDIARSRSNYQEGYFTLSRGDGFLYFPSGEYSVIFRIDGVIRVFENGNENTVDIPPQDYIAKVILEGGHDIRIDDIRKL